MGPNRQRKKPTGRGRGRGGGQAQHAPAGVASGMSVRHREMLLDVLRHAATGGSSAVDESAFSITGRSGGSVRIVRNRPKTVVDHIATALEIVGFTAAAAREFAAGDRASLLPLPADVSSTLDLVGSPEFVVAAEWALLEAAVDSDQEAPDGSTSSMRHAMRVDEWATLHAVYGDHMPEAFQTGDPPPLFDAAQTDAFAEGTDDDEQVEDEGGDGAEPDDDEDQTTIEFTFATAGAARCTVSVTIVEAYPDHPPLLSLKSDAVLPRAAAGVTGEARRAILAAAAHCLNSFPRGAPVLVPLLSSISDAIASVTLEPPKVTSAQAAVTVTAGGLPKDTSGRGDFLDKLVKHTTTAPTSAATASAKDKKAPAAAADDAIAGLSDDTFMSALAPPTQLRAVEAKQSAASFSQATFLLPNPVEDKALLERWGEVKKSGPLMPVRNALPAFALRDELKRALASHNCVVVGGETGSGKTTQIPQYILEFFIEAGTGSRCNIVCTQPRRIAASSVALRVAEERDEPIGGLVGYSIRLENKMSKRTRLLFCTTGILLRRLQSDPSIGNVSHVVVDEIHERGIDTDFLLILLKDLMQKRPDLKVILMSATMDAGRFSTYFGNAPVIAIPGRTHPVTIVPLEAALVASAYVLEDDSQFALRVRGTAGRPKRHESAASADISEYQQEEALDRDVTKAEATVRVACGEVAASSGLQLKLPALTPASCTRAASTMIRMDPARVNYELIESIILLIEREFPQRPNEPGAVVVFLPGLAEITQCMEQLMSNRGLSAGCVILNLHSSLGNASQQAVFARPPRGKRKIVLGTNIMETSVTIDDAVFVIDCGKFKENRYDAKRALSQLVTCWVSKAAASQRKGRAGRVRPGMCFRLYSTAQYEQFIEHQVCEMHRVPLESLILQIHALNLGDEMAFLQKALDPPTRKAVEYSIKSLNQLGALSKEKMLTSLGLHLANLPIDVRVGKMIVYGAILKCVDPVITIAACLSGRSPFSAHPDDQADVEAMRRSFSRDYQSDFASAWFAYQKWMAARETSREAERQLIRDAHLSSSALANISSTKRQLERYLVESGFLQLSDAESATRSRAGGFAPHKTLEGSVYECGGADHNANSGSMKCILAAILGGLHPNVARIERVSAPTAPGRSAQIEGTSSDGTRVSIHPSSVNARRAEFTYPFVAYAEKIKTSATFIRDTTMVSPYTLILFGGPCRYAAGAEELSYDDWVSFRCCAADAALLLTLRRQLDAALTQKINDPTLQWESVAANTVRAIVKLLHDESSTSLTVTGQRRRVDPRAGLAAPAAASAPAAAAKPFAVAMGGIPTAGDASMSYGQRMRLQSKVCFNCGDKGHLSRDCQNNSRRFPGGPQVPCFVCGARAHHPPDCPLTRCRVGIPVAQDPSAAV